MVTIRDKAGLFELGHQISELEEPEEIWTHFLDGLRRVTGSHSSFLQQNDLCTEHPPMLISRGVDQSLIDQYLEHYYRTDIWAEAVAAQTSPEFHNIQQLVDQKKYLSSELFELQKQQSSYFGAGMQLRIRNRTGIMLTFHRDKTLGPFDDEDMKLLNHLVPVLYENLWRISDKKLLSQQGENAFAYIDSDLRIFESNKAFQDACLESYAIDISDGRINLTDAAKAAELSEQIRQLYNGMAAYVTDVADAEMSLFDQDGNIELGLTLKPDSGQATRYGIRMTGYCLRVEIKKYHCLKINWERVGRHYTLTPSELEVLKLVYENLSRAEIAKKRNCSPETIKTQVRSIENKLGANNQMKIMKLIHSQSYFIEETTE